MATTQRTRELEYSDLGGAAAAQLEPRELNRLGFRDA